MMVKVWCSPVCGYYLCLQVNKVELGVGSFKTQAFIYYVIIPKTTTDHYTNPVFVFPVESGHTNFLLNGQNLRTHPPHHTVTTVTTDWVMDALTCSVLHVLSILFGDPCRVCTQYVLNLSAFRSNLVLRLQSVLYHRNYKITLLAIYFRASFLLGSIFDPEDEATCYTETSADFQWR